MFFCVLTETAFEQNGNLYSAEQIRQWYVDRIGTNSLIIILIISNAKATIYLPSLKPHVTTFNTMMSQVIEWKLQH